MIIVNGVFLPRYLLSARFNCPYEQCKGACCVEGERGAPLLNGEIPLIRPHLPALLADLDNDSVQTIRQNDFYEGGADDWATSCISRTGRCVFTVLNRNRNVSCQLEIHSRRQNIPTLRPISCRLFPLRVRSYNGLDILDYEVWNECHEAWHQGPYLLDFCRDALSARFGQDWLEKLDLARSKMPTSDDGQPREV
ncbi:DUF3109 family protein [bacterium]|nr:DUF3109 family protein [candidate division CSSED10-310 bacterium]